MEDAKSKVRPIVRSARDELLAKRAAVVKARNTGETAVPQPAVRPVVMRRPPVRPSQHDYIAEPPEPMPTIPPYSARQEKALAPARTLIMRVPAGIGDVSWIYSKFCCLNLPMVWQICGQGPHRTTPFAEMLPNVKEASYEGIEFPTLRRRALKAEMRLAEILAKDPSDVLHVECNTHLEGGKRIESWLPDLRVTYHYDLAISDAHYDAAAVVRPKAPYVCFYTSNVKHAQVWRSWLPQDWLELAGQLRQMYGALEFVIVGAEYDEDMATAIVMGAGQRGLVVHNLCGKLHIGSTLSIMKEAEYFVSATSGLGILADVMSIPATMMYHEDVRAIRGTYADPKRIASGDFRETSYAPPSELVKWLLNTYNLPDRIGGR